MNSFIKPKIGIAMSGSAARSVYYIGFLEGLAQADIAIDFITAYSGAAIISAAYACGTLNAFKEEALNLNFKQLFGILQRSQKSTGWYSLDHFEDYFRQKYTRGLTLESVKPRLCFLAVDINSKQLVELNLGDIARAVRISCTMPGVFEPVPWGNQLLVDGGLAASVPGDIARRAGMDFVIGVQVRSTKYFFIRNEKAMDFVRRQLIKMKSLKKYESWLSKLKTGLIGSVGIFEYLEEIKLWEQQDKRNLGIFNILGKCLDIAAETNEKQKTVDTKLGCDILISVGTPSLIDGMNVRAGRQLYEKGLKDATTSIPKIKTGIQNIAKGNQNQSFISKTSAHDPA